jgi:neutral ceramidase
MFWLFVFAQFLEFQMPADRRFSLLCVLTFIASLIPIQFVQAGLKAGASKKSIVPPFPTQMGGFYDRTGNFEGVHDEIFARALVLDNGQTKLAFIGTDLTYMDADLTRLTREAVTQATGIPTTHVLTCCAHNHSAPSFNLQTQAGTDDVEPSLKRFLARQMAEAVIEADQALIPARVGFGAGTLVGATRNRQQKNDLIDPQVGVLRMEELETRKTIATLFNFTGHPVIIGSTNLSLSGEYPGAASRAVENLLGGVAIFAQGACGDITVNRNGDPFLEIERLGRTLAGEVIKTSGLVKLEDDAVLKAASTTLTLPAREVPGLEEAKTQLQRGTAALEMARQNNASAAVIGLLEDKNRVYSIAVRKAQALAEDPGKRETELKAEVQVLQVGNVTYGAIPGELFVEYALELRSRVKQDTGNSFCLIGYANGHLGYIVTPRAMETGGYETSMTRLQPLAGRTLTEAVMNLVHDLNR